MAENHSAETILQEALDLADLLARAAYLDEACGDDETLREEVESLLAARFAADRIGCHKIGQFVRRNRTAFVGVATITILLVAGVAGTSWIAKQAAENLKRSQFAQEMEQEAKEKEDEATEKKREARQPTADRLMVEAHSATTLRQLDLTGFIRKGDTKFSVALYRRGKNIQFAYHEPDTKKPIRFHVRHGIVDTGQLDLFEIVDGKTLKFPDEKLGQAIEGTDFCYEDLTMSFFYWPKAILEGSKKTKGQDCWVVRAVNPGKIGNYRQVRVWIHKKTHALMQVVGYDRQGHPLKRMLVTEFMKVGEGGVIGLIAGNADSYASRRIRFDSIDPVANKVVGVTYLEFDKPKSIGP